MADELKDKAKVRTIQKIVDKKTIFDMLLKLASQYNLSATLASTLYQFFRANFIMRSYRRYRNCSLTAFASHLKYLH